MPKTIDEQIAAPAKRAATAAAIDAIMAKAAEEGRVLETDEESKYDEHKETVRNLDNHLVRLRDHAEIVKATPAKPAGQENEVNPPANAIVVREHQTHLQNATRIPRVQIMEPKIEPWQPFTRYVQAIAAGRGDLLRTREWVKNQVWNDSMPQIGKMVELEPRDLAHQLQCARWSALVILPTRRGASPLIAYTQAANLFAEYLRLCTIMGSYCAMCRSMSSRARDRRLGQVGWRKRTQTRHLGSL
jgi:hypothetical protein